MNKKEKRSKIENQGITLIALVITIIVLLILAGVSIAMLTGQNGILSQAQNAAEQTEIANAKEQAQMDILEWQSDKLEKGESADLDNTIIKGILTGKDYVGTAGDDSFTTKNGKYTILYSELYANGDNQGGGSENAGEEISKPSSWPEDDEIIAISDGKGKAVPLPNDFNYVGGDRETGIVISDEPGDDLENSLHGNQFVWIPVDDYSKFVRQEGYYDGDASVYLPDCGEADSAGANENAGGDKITETGTTKTEAIAMYKSVKDYGGFYIGRYETGKDENGKAVIRAGVTPYNNVPWSSTRSMTEDENIDGTENGAIEQARYFAKANRYTSVISTLCYGVQWDAALNYIDPNYITNAEIGTPNCAEASFVRDSDGKGWYNQSNPTNTGYYQIKNIYDLAGNAAEWTMESYSTYGRVDRGGDYHGDSGFEYPSSNRSGYDPGLTDSFHRLSYHFILVVLNAGEFKVNCVNWIYLL